MSATFEVAWAVGLIASMARAGSFVIASPLFARALPVPGRLALSLALGLALARPIVEEPTMPTLVGLVVTNVAVGLALAFLTGILIYAFEIAGSMVDFTSGLIAASIFDPATNAQVGVFGRTFNMAGAVLLFLSGADRYLIKALDLTRDAIPLSGGLSFPADAADYATETMSSMMVLSVQIALPALGALFLIELVLALGARLAPQANVFILGLPAKMLASFMAVGVVTLLLPNAVDTVLGSFEDGLMALLGGPIGG